MRNNLFITISVIALLIHASAKGQLSTSYSFGNIMTSSTAGSTFSGPIVIEGNNPCFNLTSGVALFEKSQTGFGRFMMTCETVSKSEFEFESYPNPVVSSVKVFINGQVNPNEKYSMQIFSANGEVLQSTSGNLGQFMNGLSLNMYPYTDGLYLIKIKTTHLERSIKIIKIKN
jgi:hypothetical protein